MPLYDDRLSEAVETLLNAWGRAFSEDQAYTEMAGDEGYVFSSRMSGGNGSVGTARWDRIEAARCDMRLALNLILKRVRNDYLEIDIDETDKIAWARYQMEMAEIDS